MRCLIDDLLTPLSWSACPDSRISPEPPIEQLPDLTAVVATEHNLHSLLARRRAARRDLTIPARLEDLPIPLAFALGAQAVQEIGLDHARRPPLPTTPPKPPGPTECLVCTTPSARARLPPVGQRCNSSCAIFVPQAKSKAEDLLLRRDVLWLASLSFMRDGCVDGRPASASALTKPREGWSAWRTRCRTGGGPSWSDRSCVRCFGWTAARRTRTGS
ncbi:DUF6177 family protein [Streptantibioticus ferralitis]|uniref:DUF6177 family protein n=1 Tax=Streptantibioticus ferralitis TaxID=236510 RepID=UPI0035569222